MPLNIQTPFNFYLNDNVVFTPTKGAIYSDSINAPNYLGQNGTDYYLINQDDVLLGYEVVNNAVPGNVIGQQRQVYENDLQKNTYDWIIIQLAVNNMVMGGDIEAIINEYQSFINYIRLTGKPGVKIIISLMTPCKQRLIDINYSVENFNIMNDSIEGLGDYPIINVDARVTAHYDILSDGFDNLAAEYEISGVNDHIHVNNLGKQNGIAFAWKQTLINLNQYKPY